MCFSGSHFTLLHRMLFCTGQILLISMLIEVKSIIYTCIFGRNASFVWETDDSPTLLLSKCSKVLLAPIYFGALVIIQRSEFEHENNGNV